MTTPAPRYKITQVRDSTSYDAQRGAHRTKQVHVRFADGTSTYVELPADQYTPENVQQAIEAAATTHESVMAIQPGMPPTMPTTPNNPWG